MNCAKKVSITRNTGASHSASLRFVLILVFLASVFWPPVSGLYAQTELGSEDDLTVLGTNGTAGDPDTEIKGFTVFGSTQAGYTGAVIGSGNVVVNGVLSVSSGAYFAGNSTFTSAGKIFINDGSSGQVLRKGAAGSLTWDNVSALGDDLGSHVATQNLVLQANQLTGTGALTMSSITASGPLGMWAARLVFDPNIEISSYTSAVYGKGVYLSTFVFTPGLAITQYGELQTTGAGRGSVAGAARGPGAVDLQVNRGLATQVASGGYAVIGGGQQNTAAGLYAVVLGGSQNTAGNQYSTVGGGVGNNASGDRAVVPGGDTNLAGGLASFAAGSYARAGAAGAFTWADSQGVAIENGVADRTVFKNRGGFLITGSTNTALSGAANRGVLLTGDGLVGISTGTPYAALDVVSTGTAAGQMAQVWRDSGGTIVSSVSATGALMAAKFIGNGSGLTGIPGDNLGNHTATQNLDLSGRELVGVSTLTVSSITTAGAGVIFSTNAYFTNGNVGIGTTGPRAILDIKGGDIILSNNRKLRADTSVGGADIRDLITQNGFDNVVVANTIGQTYLEGYRLHFDVAEKTDAIYIAETTGNVGIGTTGPGAKLQIAAADDSVAPVLSFRQGNAPAYGYDWDHDTLVNGDLSLMRVENSVRSQVLTIQRNSGNIGIGTTSPGAKLDFAAATGEKIRLYGDGNAAYSIGVEANELRFAGGIGANDFIAFRTQGYTGTERVRLTGTGNVGIGTTTPQGLLHVGAGAAPGLLVTNTGNVGIGTTGPGGRLDVVGSAGLVPLIVSTGSAVGSEVFRINSSGNVGIRTTSPGLIFGMGTPLHINGAESAIRLDDYVDNTGTAQPALQHSGGIGVGWLGGGVNALVMGTVTDTPIRIRTNNTDKVTVLSAGNVGIGTTAPGSRFEVVGGSSTFKGSDSNSAIAGFTDAGGNYRVVISTPGNVGIGTTDLGSNKLSVAGNISLQGGSFVLTGASASPRPMFGSDATAHGQTIVRSIDSDAGDGIQFQNYAGSALAEILNSGNVGIGTTSPGYKLDVAGTMNAQEVRVNGVVLNPGTGSNWTVSGANVYRNGGNVGIGTTNPVNALDIRGTIYALANLAGYNPIDAENTNIGGFGPYFAGGGGDSAKYILAVADYTGSQKFKVDGLGNVGIGTASPAVKLHVETGAAGSPSAIFRQTHAGDSPGIQIYQRYGGAGDDLNYGIQLISGGVVRFWVRGDGTTYNQGNVGIGTTVPTHNLHVAGNAIVVSSLSISGSGLTGAASIFQVGGGSLTVLANGNVGIGATPAAYTKLLVRAQTGYNFWVRNDGATKLQLEAANDAGTLDVPLAIESSALYLNSNSGGNVGIGTTAPGYKLDVNGDMNLAAGGVYRIGGVAQSGSSKWTQGTGDNIYRTLGNVGIGTGDPSLGVPLEVAKTAGIYGPIIGLSGPAGAGGKTFYMLSSASGNSAGAGKFVLYESGHTGDLVIDNYNVGIGTTSPESRLHIRPGTDQNIKFSPFVNGGNGTALTASNDIAANKNNFEIIASNILLTPTNNVGIGTTAPGQKLEVSSGNIKVTGLSAAQASVYINKPAASDAQALTFQTAGVDKWNMGVRGNNSYLELWDSPAGTNMLTIAPSGNVGIGTTGPVNKLHVYGAGGGSASTSVNNGIATIGATSGVQLSMGTEPATPYGFYLQTKDANNAGPYGYPILLNPINGNVGIGTTSPQSALDVITPANSFVSVGSAQMGVGSYAGIHFGYREANTLFRKSAIVFERTDNAGFGGNAAGKVHILNGPASGSGSATLADARLTIGELGNVGIGTTSPGYKLDVESGDLRVRLGTIRSHLLAVVTPQTHVEFQNANGVIGSITSNGSATAYNTSSDRRLKEHISATTAGLAALAQIPVVDFNFISDPARRVQGFIAQDLYKYYPEAVNVGGDDPKKTPWSVDYGRLTPLLVKSVQELDQRTKGFAEYADNAAATAAGLPVGTFYRTGDLLKVVH